MTKVSLLHILMNCKKENNSRAKIHEEIKS